MKTNNRSRAILENLRDLNLDGATRLFNELLANTKLIEKTSIDYNIMFLFPDGRMLGQKTRKGSAADKMPPGYMPDLSRQINHNIISDYLPKDWQPNNQIWKHPLFDKDLAKYYNIIIVAYAHIGGNVIVPKGVEPTQAQIQRLQEMKDWGYKITGYKL